MKHHNIAAAAAVAACVAACSPSAAPSGNAVDQGGTAGSASNDAAAAPAASTNPAAPGAATPATREAFTAEGLGTLRIGARVDQLKGSKLVGGEDYSEACRIRTSEDYLGVQVLTENGVIKRLTLASHWDPKPTFRTDRGIGLGASEADVRKAYGPLREEGHKYVNPPAKNLYFGDAGGKPGLRFEIGEKGDVRQIHAGRQPALGLVEGCS